MVLNSQESFCVQSTKNHDLETFLNELVKTIGVINTLVKCNDWAAVNLNITNFEDGHRPIIGQKFFPQLGLSLTQTKQVSNVDQNQFLIKKQIAFGLFFRNDKPLKRTVKSTFHKYFKPTHQKGRRVPINLQPLVNAALNKL